MKKILLISPPFGGHLNVFKALFREYRDKFDFRLLITGWTNIHPDLKDLNIPTEIIARSELNETDPALWTLPRLAELLSSCTESVERTKPDLIIYDFFSLEGYMIGKKLNIPYWCSIPALMGPFNSQEYLKSKLLSPNNVETLKILNLDPDKIEMISDGLHIPGQLNLIWSYPSLTPQDFMQNRKPAPYKFIGNLTKQSDNIITAETRNRPLVYFSLGTVIMDNLWNQQENTRKKLQDFIALLAEKWKNESFDVLFVNRGKHVLDAYPENWRVIDHANQISALSEASVFITHAGGNSFHEAVLKKVPMIAIPFFGDQPLIANQIEKLGLGINLVPDDKIDTKKSKDFLDASLAQKAQTAVKEILDNQAKYKTNFTKLELKAENIGNLLRS